jgi:hypothetical protein
MATSFSDPRGEKAAPILAGGGQKDASEGAPEDVGAGKAGAVGDFVDALRRPLEQTARDALPPRNGRGVCLFRW